MTRGTLIALRVGEAMTVTKDDDPVAATAELRARMQGLYDQTIEAYEPKPEAGAWWWPSRFGGGAPTLDDMRAQEAAERERRESGQ